MAWQPQPWRCLLDSSIQVPDLHIAWLKQSLAAEIFSFWKAPYRLIPPFPYPLSLSTLSSPPLLFPSLAGSTLGSVGFSSLPLCQYLSGFLLAGHPLDLISVPKSLHPSHSTLRAHFSGDTQILGMRKDKFNLRKPRRVPCSGSHFDKKQMQKQS